MASISCVQTYGSNKNAGFFGYANGNYTYGYYNVTFNYSGISHDGGTLNINGAYVNLKNPNSGYTTNTVYINSVIVNGTNVGLSASEKGNKSYHSFSTPSKNVSVSCGASATSCTVAVNCSRTGGGSQTLYGTLSFSSSTGSFNLNILLPDGSEPYTTGAAGSVEFSSNGGSSYTRLYNEPSNSYVIGTSFVCRNFTPGTGLHLSGTSGFNNNGGSGPWYATQGNSTVLTFNTAWNTFTNRISHWTWGYKNGEGNNSTHKAFSLGTTTWGQTYGDTFTMNASRGTTIPNGFTLRQTFGTSYISGTWTNYPFGTNVTQGNSAADFEYDYDPISYTISYTMNGGTNNSLNPTSYSVLYGITFFNPTRSGYNFTGWTIDGKSVTGINPGANATFSSSTDLYNKCSARTTGNKTVVANWLEIPPSNVSISGQANSPFQIGLSWSATGLNISNYMVYYRKQGTTTWSSQSFGTSTSGTISADEETTYEIYVKATNPGGSGSSSTITVTTPADQAKIRIKKDGVWKKGKTYFKKDGTWIKAKKVYIKVNGEWKINNNYDS